ncbi:MAG: carbamate kinase [Clostridia bacterium]|nr:carbamate kinase [Clostridia bacterium]
MARIVIALGGNALGSTLPEQMKAVSITSRAIADLIQAGHDVIISHGNGPQVGMINHAMAALSRENPTHPNTPLSVCVAMSQAYIGYDLQNALREELSKRGIKKPVTTMITQVRVDEHDPAFLHPDKPIGHFMTKEQAEYAKKEYGYQITEDSGRGYRRVVASPRPVEIIEIESIRTLVEAGDIVIAAGGGGIPVCLKGTHLRGISAVIDKDFVSAKMAQDLNADILIILTAVEKVAIHFNKPDVKWLTKMTVSEAAAYMNDQEFAAGSMLPKVRAAMEFTASRKDRFAVITLLTSAKDALDGKTGTRILND